MSYHGPTCRHNPKLPASVCGHWWCAWRRMILYYLVPSLVFIAAIVLLTPAGHWFVNEVPSQIGYPN
ncbi:MAG TPA: hypothetical protein VF444_10955 [Pseudonocardiaceae bacterium]